MSVLGWVRGWGGSKAERSAPRRPAFAGAAHAMLAAVLACCRFAVACAALALRSRGGEQGVGRGVMGWGCGEGVCVGRGVCRCVFGTVMREGVCGRGCVSRVCGKGEGFAVAQGKAGWATSTRTKVVSKMSMHSVAFASRHTDSGQPNTQILHLTSHPPAVQLPRSSLPAQRAASVQHLPHGTWPALGL